MCDASDILQSSALFWMLSLIPAKIFPYLAVGLLSASFIIYGLRYSCPAVTLDRLENTITTVEEILTHAKAKCMRDYFALVEAETRFRRTKLAVSRLHSRLLEARHMPGWKPYLRDIFTISRALSMLEREVRDIQTSLVVFIEAAHQRRLTADIREGQEIGDGVLHPQYSVRARDSDKESLIWALSLVPSSILPYLALGVMPVSLIIHTLRHSCPSMRLDRPKNGITLLEEILTQAKAKCTRDFLALVQAEIRFLQTERAVSRLESGLLETHIVPGWRDYLRGMFTISRALTMLEREVQDIEKALLVGPNRRCPPAPSIPVVLEANR
ncbi:hypothetical protein DFH08DRAFT_960245 [Mycena albidolilacea]|uniref:Uncharacterized protein n=1 Tax=Mycena albidolilacea TaxID=1033008 RepID=A0AAD7ERV8_9AGAR|nr:hypothetical protein DFH08DRAFT_960245 [Mycena albidolilacea]